MTRSLERRATIRCGAVVVETRWWDQTDETLFAAARTTTHSGAMPEMTNCLETQATTNFEAESITTASADTQGTTPFTATMVPTVCLAGLATTACGADQDAIASALKRVTTPFGVAIRMTRFMGAMETIGFTGRPIAT